MSISSMLGNDGDKPARETAAPSRGKAYDPRTEASTPTHINHSVPPSPQNPPASAAPKQVASPPESFNSMRREHSSSHLSYGNESPRRPLSGPPASISDSQRFGPPIREPNKYNDVRQQNNAPISRHGAVHQDSHGRHPSLGRIDNATSSQHFGYRTPPTEAEMDARTRAEQGSSIRMWRNADEQREAEAVVMPSTNARSIGRQPPNNLVGAIYEHKVSREQRAFQPQTLHEPQQDGSNGHGTTNYPFLTRHSNPSANADRSNHMDSNAAVDRNTEPQSEGPHRSSSAVEAFRRLRDARHPGTSVLHYEMKQSPGHVTSYPLDLVDARQVQDRAHVNASIEEERRSRSLDQPNNATSEAHEQPRSSLNLLLDSNKKYGRISPLPQAVQGAQGQMRGPASEPGIKSEFARMFSGIGSGVGSGIPTPTPMESGTSISFPSSPTRLEEHERRTPFSGRGELVELMKPRNSSRGGRKGRKVKDEDSKRDAMMASGTEARPGAGRGSRKSRNSQTHYHHVHHVHHTHHVPQ